MKHPHPFEPSDLRHLPQPVHDAVLHVLETLVQAFPLPAEAVLVDAQSEASPPPFPRSALEQRVLAALQALSPMPATPLQVAAMVHTPHLEVRTTLQALAMLGTVEHPSKGYYRHRQPANDVRPSAHFAAQIVALCVPNTQE